MRFLKKSPNKASKPTQAQGLCGLSSCYTDARTGALLRNLNMKKVVILLCIGLIFVGCNKKSQNENKTNIQNEETVIVNNSSNNIVVSDSTETIIIKGDNNTVSTESSKDNYNETNIVLPYFGTYLPEVYISSLLKNKSHRKASEEFRNFDEENPNALFINKKYVQGIYNFHEGSAVEILNVSEESIIVKTSIGKETYKLEDNQYINIGNTKYKKISNVNDIDGDVISNFLTELLIPQNELKNENTGLKVIENKIYYNDNVYEYGTELVGNSPVYDYIINKESYESKYIEILEHEINIYTAYSPDNNYDMGWMKDAIYKIENSFVY